MNTYEQFCFWIKGITSDIDKITPEQALEKLKIIKSSVNITITNIEDPNNHTAKNLLHG